MTDKESVNRFEKIEKQHCKCGVLFSVYESMGNGQRSEFKIDFCRFHGCAPELLSALDALFGSLSGLEEYRNFDVVECVKRLGELLSETRHEQRYFYQQNEHEYFKHQVVPRVIDRLKEFSKKMSPGVE